MTRRDGARHVEAEGDSASANGVPPAAFDVDLAAAATDSMPQPRAEVDVLSWRQRVACSLLDDGDSD